MGDNGDIKFERIAIIGIGLIGASIALAARRNGMAGHIVAYDVNAEARAEAGRLGLVDQIGDFKDSLDAVAEAGNCRPAPRWLRPGRSFSQRLMGRSGAGPQGGGNIIAEGLQRLMAGGIYYLEPGYLAGGYPDTSS